MPGARTKGSDEAVGVLDTPLKSTPWKDMLRAILLARRRAVADANRLFIPEIRIPEILLFRLQLFGDLERLKLMFRGPENGGEKVACRRLSRSEFVLPNS